MNKAVRILQIVPSLSICGGVENYLMNYYRHIDKRKIQFDFMTHSIPEVSFKDEIENFGGRIYDLPVFNLSTGIKIVNSLAAFFAQYKQYKIIHCHMANAALFYFWTAKKYGVKVRILHSHQSEGADSLSHRLRNYPLLFLGKQYTTYNIACSKLAGDFLFRNKNYIIINNAINTNKFSFDFDVRTQIRKQYGILDKFVVGHVGRFCNQKNQLFLLDIFSRIYLRNPKAVLLLVGAGDLEDEIRKKINDLKLHDSVILTGVCANTNELYQAMDVFVLPSLYEGLPVVGVEAQAAGLKTFVADTITKELKITDLVTYLSLRQTAEEWANAIIDSQKDNIRKTMAGDIALAGFDIVDEAVKLEKQYLKLYDLH